MEPGQNESSGSSGGQAKRVGAIALLLGGSVALSRVLGYFREVALANQLGASTAADAYFAAFLIPDVLNYLLAGGALTIAFVPFYSRVRRERGDAAAQQLFETVLGATTAVAVGATVALAAAADAIVARVFGDFDAPTQALTAHLVRILLPAQIFFVSGGLIRAVLMVEDRFTSHALAPLVYTLGIIAGGLATGTPEGFAWGALVGAFLGPFLLPLLDLRRTHRVALRFDFLSRDLRAYLWLAAPLMLGVSLTTVDEWYEKYFGQFVAVGAIAWLGFARKLVQAPIAMVGQAIGVAALPTLTRLWAARQEDEFEAVLRRVLQAAIGLGSLASVGLVVFAEPLVEIVYRHGAFGDADAARVASVLAAMGFAALGWVVQQVGIRAFYAREEMWRAMGLGTGMALASLPLYVVLGERNGAEASPMPE